MKKSFAGNKNVRKFESSINVQFNVNSIIHFKDTPRRSVATLSLGIGVDRASEPGAIRIMDTTERWATAPGFPDYEISNKGAVRSNRFSVKTGFTLRQSLDAKQGYFKVCIRKEGKPHVVKVHRLVALAFIVNPNNYPVVNHIDGNKQNNKVTNLEWCTHSHNSQHAHDNNLVSSNPVRGEKHHSAKLNRAQVLEIRSAGVHSQQKELALIYNVHPSVIGKILRNETWAHI